MVINNGMIPKNTTSAQSSNSISTKFSHLVVNNKHVHSEAVSHKDAIPAKSVSKPSFQNQNPYNSLGLTGFTFLSHHNTIQKKQETDNMDYAIQAARRAYDMGNSLK